MGAPVFQEGLFVPDESRRPDLSWTIFRTVTFTLPETNHHKLLEAAPALEGNWFPLFVVLREVIFHPLQNQAWFLP